MDRLPALLTSLLDCSLEQLAAQSVLPCRSFVNTGPNAPWDGCEVGTTAEGEPTNGQLWVTHLLSTPDWPLPTGNAKGCWPTNWSAQLELGISRCQQGKLDDETIVPDPDLVTADAAMQQADRFALLQAIVCCWSVGGKPVDARDVVFDRWESFEPSGGCVASRWVFRVRVGSCTC